MITQAIAILTALSGAGLLSWVAALVKQWLDRGHRRIHDESIVAATTRNLIEPVQQESERRLQRIVFLKRVIRRLDDYVDECRDTARTNGVALPPMSDELRSQIDEIGE